jgi:uncharacterized protein YprB with RNaseH-like and TPR domain
MELNGQDLAEEPSVAVASPPSRRSRSARAVSSTPVAVTRPDSDARIAPSFLPLYEKALPPQSRLTELIPGYECATDHGPYYCVDTLLTDLGPEWKRVEDAFPAGWAKPSPFRTGELKRVHGYKPENLLFLDVETMGLRDSMIFLIGLMKWEGTHFRIRQLLARRAGEEAAILAATNDLLPFFQAVISFNGKTFDLPLIGKRTLHHRIASNEVPHHVDLLHHSRRRWKGLVPNCRLQTLEFQLCGRQRVGDIPSSQIPGVYRRFLSNGDPTPLQPILYHNLVDLVTMAELLTLMNNAE